MAMAASLAVAREPDSPLGSEIRRAGHKRAVPPGVAVLAPAAATWFGWRPDHRWEAGAWDSRRNWCSRVARFTPRTPRSDGLSRRPLPTAVPRPPLPWSADASPPPGGRGPPHLADRV